jgi:hypothetical protein
LEERQRQEQQPGCQAGMGHRWGEAAAGAAQAQETALEAELALGAEQKQQETR